jgi:hypothetical protein
VYSPVARKPKNSAGLGKPTVYGSATGPSVAAAPCSRRFLHHCFVFGSCSVIASPLARCQATAPGTKRQQSTYLLSEYQPQ